MSSRISTRDSVIITPAQPKKKVQTPQTDEGSFRGFFENAVVGIFKSTVDGAPVEANQAMASMLGYGSPKEMISDVADSSKFYAAPESRANIVKAALDHEGKLMGWEEPLRRKDGSTFTASLNIRIVFDQGGRPAFMEGFVEDISDQKRMHEAIRESEEKFRSLFEESPIGFVIFDGLGRLLMTNKASLEIFGVNNTSDVVGSRLFDIPYIDEKARQDLAAGKTIRKDLRFDFDEINRRGIFSSSKRMRCEKSVGKRSQWYFRSP